MFYSFRIFGIALPEILFIVHDAKGGVECIACFEVLLDCFLQTCSFWKRIKIGRQRGNVEDKANSATGRVSMGF